MSDLIRRQDAINAMATWDWQDLYLPIHFQQLLEELPSAEPNTGRWVNNTNGTYACDRCGCKHSRSKYCPSCGAKMEGGEDE